MKRTENSLYMWVWHKQNNNASKAYKTKQHEHYVKNKELYMKRARANHYRYKTVRIRYKALKILALGSEIKCVRCGFSDIRILQVDHVKNNGYNETAERVYKKILCDPLNADSEYQILCPNCNWLKKFELEEIKRRRIDFDEDES